MRCKNALCRAETYHRGLCESCYHWAYVCQRRGILTYQDQVADGRMLPDECSSLLIAAFNRVQSGIDPNRMAEPVDFFGVEFNNPGMCITPGCTDNANHRGLCHKCWEDASSLVAGNQSSFSELESLGLIDREWDVPSGSSLFRVIAQEIESGESVVIRKLDQEVSSMVGRGDKTHKCNTPSCSGVVKSRRSRGLCAVCFMEAGKVVADGISTIEKLLQSGLILDVANSEPFTAGDSDDANSLARNGHPLTFAISQLRLGVEPPERSGSESTDCLIPNCGRPKHARGICSRCYRKAYKMQSDGEITFSELSDAGLMLPDQREAAKNSP